MNAQRSLVTSLKECRIAEAGLRYHAVSSTAIQMRGRAFEEHQTTFRLT